MVFNELKNLAVSLTRVTQILFFLVNSGPEGKALCKMRWYVKSNSCKAKVGAFLMLKYFRIFEVGGGCIYIRKCKESHYILRKHYGSGL